METETTQNGVLENWSAEEVQKAFSANEIILIDVRTPQEFALERIDGALLAPMQAFKPEHMPDQQGKPIVFHCGSGVRSRKAAGLPYTGTDMATGAPKQMRSTS